MFCVSYNADNFTYIIIHIVYKIVAAFVALL